MTTEYTQPLNQPTIVANVHNGSYERKIIDALESIIADNLYRMRPIDTETIAYIRLLKQLAGIAPKLHQGMEQGIKACVPDNMKK